MLDVIIIGAGPAGSVTATLLRRLGFEVEIWERTPFPRHRIGESLPPRAVALLRHLGLKIDDFAVMEGHTSIWGTAEPHRAVFQEGYGLQVERERFDQMLLEQSGCGIHFGKVASGLIKEKDRVVGVRSTEGETRARYIVMATGPGKATRHLRQSAIFGYWRNSKHPEGSQANDTIIEAFPDGWVWSLRLASDQRNVTVVFDSPGTSYLEAIRQTSFVRQMLEGAELISRPVGCDASWQCVDSFAEAGVLHVGDSGSVIDPLSSQGVYKAMCAAMSAAVVINTCIKKPELENSALDFYNEEERRTYDGYSAGSVATFRNEQRWPDRPFWKTRHDLKAWDIQPRVFSTELAHAIETGKDSSIVLGNAPGTGVAKRPTMSGTFIELAEYVVSAVFQYGYRGAHASTILRIHRSLAQPKPLHALLAELRSRDVSGLLKVIAYMYREGLISAGAPNGV